MGVAVVLLIFLPLTIADFCNQWVTVEQGGNCWQIANSNGINTTFLQKMNKDLNCDVLEVGQKICVKRSNFRPNCTKWYTILSGDFCYKIWTDNRISEAILMELNENLDCNVLVPGKRLCVSVEDQPGTTGNSNTTDIQPKNSYCLKYISVKSGDTCWEIASNENITVENLMSANPDLNCDTLQINQRICINTSLTPPECGKWKIVKENDSCESVIIDNKISQREFDELNTDINCTSLEMGAPLCIASSVKPFDVNITETNSTECAEVYKVIKGDRCHKISVYFNIKLSVLTNKYNCDALNIGDEICVSETEKCQLRYQISPGDICYQIRLAFKLFPGELESINGNFDCDNLQIDRKICVWPESDIFLGNYTCTTTVKNTKDKNCLKIAESAGITIDEFRFLNPALNCDGNVPLDTAVCTSSEMTKKCSFIANVNGSLSCSQLADIYQMDLHDLLKLNPLLRCDRLNMTEQICTGTGYFSASYCVSSLRVTHELSTCLKVAMAAGINSNIVERLNPGIDCSKNLTISSLVCVTSLGMETSSARDQLITVLEKNSPQLKNAYLTYNKNPNEENAVEMSKIIQSSLLKPDVNEILKDLYKTDTKIRTILNSQHPLPRNEYCNQMKETYLSERVKSCYCGDDELLMYCQALSVQEIQEIFSENYQTEIRSKRGIDCSLGNLFGEFSIDAPETLSMFDNCWGGDCAIPILGILEISIDANICVPPIKKKAGKITFCGGKADSCKDIDEDDKSGLQEMAAFSTEASLSHCVVGSSAMKTLARIIKFGGSLCWKIIDGEFHPFVGRLRLGTELSLILFTIKGGAKIKTYDMVLPSMCDKEKFECEDYCLFRYNNWKNGKAYGYIEFRLLAVFGFAGIKVFDVDISGPNRAGCHSDSQAAVVLMNKRTCKDDRTIFRRCWQGKQKKNFEELEDEYGFEFKPNSRTLHVCEFVDPSGQKLGFDVYKGKSKNSGRKAFFYAVRNDGIYLGTSRYKQEELIASWEHPCEEEKEDENDNETENSPEPTGSSTVPANNCGKRIIGYYTGWGDREITENQLRKLTHVIFAFVAMSEDGSIAFGPVSIEDSPPDIGQKMERRFLDMKKKARAVNSGVRVMFAVGGWDNSQHFSSVAADSSKRRRFIDSIADFITKHGVDGVDIDWEYPVTGGAHEGVTADKENYVTLLRELREKLDSLGNRNSRYEISLASAAGEWTIRPGYDLEGILKHADFINVMTYDYYGAWGSKWGAYTGTPAPLYFGSPKGFSGKLNADFTMRYYSCRSKKPSQLNMGVPFYGRYWDNVGNAIDPTDEMWRTADAVGGVYKGCYVSWRNIEKEGWNRASSKFHEKTKTPYIFDAGRRKFLGFENEKSLREKISFATDRNIGGLMIWAIDLDDDADTLLNLVSSTSLCDGGSGDSMKFECVPIDDVRWWTPENSGPERQGQCGRSAELINGFYPVCDPDDPGFACCGFQGYCGSGDEFCKCEGCVDYRKNPKAILDEPVKPSRPIQWYLMDAPDGKRGGCGKEVPEINGKMAICNPDDPTKYCCSNGGYCGVGKEFCECDGCVNYKLKK